jgi:hypothetical protein
LEERCSKIKALEGTEAVTRSSAHILPKDNVNLEPTAKIAMIETLETTADLSAVTVALEAAVTVVLKAVVASVEVQALEALEVLEVAVAALVEDSGKALHLEGLDDSSDEFFQYFKEK